MRFRSKPAYCEAEQWFPGRDVAGVCNACFPGTCSALPGPHVHTAHQNQTVALEPGDWVIQEPDGVHYYPCKPDIFPGRWEPNVLPEQDLRQRSWLGGLASKLKGLGGLIGNLFGKGTSGHQ
jgi:hypothetical protein